MAPTAACPTCGTALDPADAPCPRCLLGVGLEPADEDEASVDPARLVGDSIGPYEIVDVLGEGGMGVVYLAEQREPLRRRVAVKVVKPGMDTREVVSRFALERQALALMEHPGIAAVHEAGVDADGRPYFVMEYVPGLPITDFCDERRATVDRRLALFRATCDAVEHAHRKGIIHRDLKPSNVLVADVDGTPAVKIIDFGISKAIHGADGDATRFTRHGVLVGTPEYMSPEQAESDGREVDTRTDVYGLGLLLYELLAGVLPFDRDAARRAARRRDGDGRFDAPSPRPSTRVAGLPGERTESLAASRGTDAARLVRTLRGELDWIVMRAVEHDPDRRYGSARELGEDLRRYLAHEPVEAGPPGVVYRAGKFVRRHRTGVTLAIAAVIALAAFAVGMTVQARRATRERDRANLEAQTARQVSTFLTELFEVSDPGEARGVDLTARELLDRGATRIDELAEQPVLQARMLATMGVVYKKIGLTAEAAALLDRALAIRRRELGASHPDTLRCMLELAEVRFLEGDLELAEALLRDALERSASALGAEHPETVAAEADLGVVLHFQGRLAEAKPHYARALELRRRLLGEEHPDTLETMNNMATLLASLGDLDAAVPMLERALDGRRRRLGDGHPEVLDSTINLCVLLQAVDRLDDAERYCRDSVDVGRRIRPDHPKTLVSINNLGKLLELQGRLHEAEPYYREALEAFTRTLGVGHPDTLSAMGNLGDLYTSLGELDRAESLLGSALDGVRAELPAEHVVTGYTVRKYGRLQAARGRRAEARRYLLEALDVLTAAVGADHPQTRRVVADLDSLGEPDGPGGE